MFKHLLRLVGRQAWLRLGVRRRLICTFVPPDNTAPFRFQVPFCGITYRGNISNFIEWHIFFFGGYEQKEAALISDILARLPGAISFDVGANLGNHTFLMSQHSKEVHSFEPYGPLADRIQEQVEFNHIQNINIHRFALGDRDEMKQYFLDLSSSNSGTGSFLAEHTGADAVTELPLRRGDTWSTEVLPDLIKVDVEGFEAPALKGMRKILTRARPVIIMEVTETSSRILGSYGGLGAIIPYSFRVFEIVNPRFPMLFLQSGHYRLKQLTSLKPRSASFNVLVVPEDRLSILEDLPRIRE